jgi:hypothetical protein
MCEMRDQPDLTMDGYVSRIRELLTRQRFVVQGVTGSTDQAEMSYSVGLTAHGLPELIVLGVRHAEAQRLLHVWGDYLLDQSLVVPGEHLTCGPFVMEAVEVERPQDHLLLAELLYGPAVRALQLAWADHRGRWPWAVGHRARRAGQPVLGQRAPGYCDGHRPDRLDVPPHP